jgi:hypothetical protein
MNDQASILEEAVKGAGGAQAVATACGLTYQAINKWIKFGMPRTEYTGETQYALTISRMNGGRYSLGQLLPPKQPKANNKN